MKITSPFLAVIYGNPDRLERIEFGVVLPGKVTVVHRRGKGGIVRTQDPPLYFRLWPAAPSSACQPMV